MSAKEPRIVHLALYMDITLATFLVKTLVVCFSHGSLGKSIISHFTQPILLSILLANINEVDFFSYNSPVQCSNKLEGLSLASLSTQE